MVKETVVESVREYLSSLAREGTPISFGVIYGSQSTGRTHPSSDIDLLVVSPRFDEVRSRMEWGEMWAKARHFDSRIEPVPCGEKQWIMDDSSAIIEIARREGEIVWPGES